ncbi:MAG: hypothetical protein ABIJ59_02675 [Pseudomonadota bacterium]
MPPWITDVIKQIGNPFLLFSLIVLWFMYKLLQRRDMVVEKLSEAIGKVSLALEKQTTLLELLVQGRIK